MAGEPESLSTNEPLAARIERHDYDRLIMLSDGVFAIAITLLALELKLPDHWNGGLAALVAGTGRPLVGYVFAFFLVGAFWMGHRRMYAKIVKADRVLALLNLLVLGMIGLAPFVARLVSEKGPAKSIPIYLLTIGIIFTLYAVSYGYAGARGLLHPAIGRSRWHGELIGLAVSALAVLSGGLYLTARPDVQSPALMILIALVAAIGSRIASARAKRQGA